MNKSTVPKPDSAELVNINVTPAALEVLHRWIAGGDINISDAIIRADYATSHSNARLQAFAEDLKSSPEYRGSGYSALKARIDQTLAKFMEEI